MMVKAGNVFAATATLALACLDGPSHAALVSLPRILKMHSERVAFALPTLAPLAHSRFCLQYPADCEARGTFRRQPASLTPKRWAELEAVNREVNRAIVPQENLGGVMTEEWVVSPKLGDCNDYAVTKRHQLLARGWPSGAVILSEVVTPQGKHHLVVVIRSRDGDFVLDNLKQAILPVAASRYRWVRAQSPDNPKFWSTVSIAASAAAPLIRSQALLVNLRNRAALGLRKSEASDCCSTDTDGRAEHSVVTEGQQQE